MELEGILASGPGSWRARRSSKGSSFFTEVSENEVAWLQLRGGKRAETAHTQYCMRWIDRSALKAYSLFPKICRRIRIKFSLVRAFESGTAFMFRSSIAVSASETKPQN